MRLQSPLNDLRFPDQKPTLLDIFKSTVIIHHVLPQDLD